MLNLKSKKLNYCKLRSYTAVAIFLRQLLKKDLNIKLVYRAYKAQSKDESKIWSNF